MPPASSKEPCPFCGEPIARTAAKCRFCGEELFEDDEAEDRPSAKARPSDAIEATDFLVPTNISGWSLASCYLGLIGFLLPFLGLIFAIPALICGIVAMTKRKKHASYSSVTSDIRAIVGLVLSSLAILGWGGLLVVILLAK